MFSFISGAAMPGIGQIEIKRIPGLPCPELGNNIFMYSGTARPGIGASPIYRQQSRKAWAAYQIFSKYFPKSLFLSLRNTMAPKGRSRRPARGSAEGERADEAG
ncbi:hypothetical protein PIB30_100703, partial [Stylosanthes scabra]|nr:hypothetical protein [Stylosanthes scabra]